MKYRVEVRSNFIISCLPDHVAELNLIEVTSILDAWAQYIEMDTGKRHDSKIYFDEAKAQEN